jgi:putative tryptophan/tyrosine transport system substrate-binding protein
MRTIDRRTAIGALGCAWLAASLPALAQGARPSRIGMLLPVSAGDPATRAQYGAFVDRLRELGYEDGKTAVLDWRFAEGRFEALPLLAGELVKANVDVIVAFGTAATAAARRVTATIPIVATTMVDPVMSGFADSLARPGRNVTGFTTIGSAVYRKSLDLLAEAVPAARQFGLFVHADDTFFLQVFPGLQAAAQKQGQDLFHVNVRRESDLTEGFARLKMRPVQAVLIGDGRYLNARSAAIAALALKYKLPTVFPSVRGVEEGGLLGYANDQDYRYQGAADYVDRILKGANPGELPIEQPTKFFLSVNKKTAAALGITLPESILSRAGKVIE